MIGTEGGWVKIRLPEREGYVCGDYLSVSHTTSGDGGFSLSLNGEELFITVQTKAGNTFYLIIDRDDKGAETVHFLNQVDEADLMALADDGEPAACSCTTRCQAGAVNMNCEICASDMTACAGPEPEPEVEETPIAEEQEPETEEKGGMSGLLLILLVVAVAGGGAFYYLKFMRNEPKTKGSTDLDDYDYGEDEEPAGEEEFSEDADVEMSDDLDGEPEDETV